MVDGFSVTVDVTVHVLETMHAAGSRMKPLLFASIRFMLKSGIRKAFSTALLFKIEKKVFRTMTKENYISTR